MRKAVILLWLTSVSPTLAEVVAPPQVPTHTRQVRRGEQPWVIYLVWKDVGADSYVVDGKATTEGSNVSCRTFAFNARLVPLCHDGWCTMPLHVGEKNCKWTVMACNQKPCCPVNMSVCAAFTMEPDLRCTASPPGTGCPCDVLPAPGGCEP